MRITAVRVRKLVSGPGYNHHAIEAEAAVGPDDDPGHVYEKLAGWVDGQLRGLQEIDDLSERRDSLRYEVKRLEDRRDALRKNIDHDNAIIARHDKLRELAAQHGLTGAEDIGDPIPF